MSLRYLATFDGRAENGAPRSVRVYYDCDLAEYLCRVSDNGKRRESADYFSNDKEDALRTAAIMCGHSLRAED